MKKILLLSITIILLSLALTSCTTITVDGFAYRNFYFKKTLKVECYDNGKFKSAEFSSDQNIDKLMELLKAVPVQ